MGLQPLAHPVAALLAVRVLLVRVKVPVDSLAMPPPKGAHWVTQKAPTLLTSNVTPETVSVPALSMPPPEPPHWSVQPRVALLLVRVLSVTVAVEPELFSMPPP